MWNTGPQWGKCQTKRAVVFHNSGSLPESFNPCPAWEKACSLPALLSRGQRVGDMDIPCPPSHIPTKNREHRVYPVIPQGDTSTCPKWTTCICCRQYAQLCGSQTPGPGESTPSCTPSPTLPAPLNALNLDSQHKPMCGLVQNVTE